MTLLYLVRHGENPANITKQFSHRKVDYSLNAKGRLQAEQTAAVLAEREIDAIYSSPLRRALETAEALARRTDQEVVILEQFRELNVGDLEDLPPTPDNWTAHNAVLRAWRRGELDTAFPGGEDFHTLWARVSDGYRIIVARHPHSAVAVFAHGGLFASTVLALCPGVDLAALLREENHNCSISEIEVAPLEPGGAGPLHGRLIAWAQCGHLSGEAAEFVSGSPAPSFYSGGAA